MNNKDVIKNKSHSVLDTESLLRKNDEIPNQVWDDIREAMVFTRPSSFRSCRRQKWNIGAALYPGLQPSGMTNAASYPSLVTPQGFYAGYSEGKRGFTLIELLVVVLIIGILAAVAVPQYQKAVIKAKLTRIDIIMNALFTSFDTYILENGIPSSAHPMDMEVLDLGIKFDSYNSGEYSYYNEYGQWQMGISSFSAYVHFHGRDSMKNIAIGIERRFPSNKLLLVDVPEKLLERKAVCQWWASRYGAGSIINGANPSYPAKTWCAEVGVQ